ncbi:hypothetical protein TWF192_004712 [Orbilia oligospora]|uniref:AB hydrolase-1 domain-containing protein n=1 Tax=Orbilia oligospora TaxID=2813651 RepID=A0A6G1MC00_ORBOL|nr:hypothetical protein TWF191_008522 [Orbilia oligospora]KAF3251752.1 hypothetical protein TWF192_004712 [Orbilia oligospora]
MIGTSFGELIIIRTAITILRSITPLSIIYTFSLPFLPSTFLTPTTKLISLYPIAETAFYFLIYLPRKYTLQAAAEHPPLPPSSERRSLFLRIISTIPDHQAYLQRWFLGAKVEDIKRDNLKEFLRWSLFNASGSWSEEPDGDEQEGEIEEYVQMVEQKMERKFEDGRGKAECYRLTIDQVRMKHRPLTWYIILTAIDTLTSIRLALSGYTYHSRPLSTFLTTFPFRFSTLFTFNKTPSPTLPYWYRPHTSKTTLPILYIHGIGIGIHPYVPTLKTLASTLPTTGIIVLEIDPISGRICPPMQKKSEMLTSINKILKHHNFERFVLVSNSYGTVVSTHILHDNQLSTKIDSMVLIDPVTILLHLPDVAYNFLRREPRRANEHMLHYFASTDQMVAHTLCRRFFWAENILWKDDLKGRNVVVWLGERDLIVDTAGVKEYLTGAGNGRFDDDEGTDERRRRVEFVNGEWETKDEEGGRLKVVWGDGLDHAQVFDEKRWYTRLVGDIAEAAVAGGRGQV